MNKSFDCLRNDTPHGRREDELTSLKLMFLHLHHRIQERIKLQNSKKAYGEVEIKRQSFLNSALDGVSDKPHTQSALLSRMKNLFRTD
jgi:hypothetical protein